MALFETFVTQTVFPAQIFRNPPLSYFSVFPTPGTDKPVITVLRFSTTVSQFELFFSILQNHLLRTRTDVSLVVFPGLLCPLAKARKNRFSNNLTFFPQALSPGHISYVRASLSKRSSLFFLSLLCGCSHRIPSVSLPQTSYIREGFYIPSPYSNNSRVCFCVPPN